MSIDIIHQELQSHLNNGQLIISQLTLTSANFNQFFLSDNFTSAYGPTGLVLNHVQIIDYDRVSIQVRGQAKLYGLVSLETLITITPVSNTFALVISTDLTASWLLGQVPPPAVNNHSSRLWGDVVFTLFQNDIKNQQCHFLQASLACDFLPLGINLETGVQIAWLDNQGNSALSDKVEYIDGQLIYSMQLPQKYTLGHISLDAIRINGIVQVILGANELMPGISLSGRLVASGISLDVEGRLNLHDGSIILNSRSPQMTISLDDLQQLLNINDIGSLASDVLQGFPVLTIAAVHVVIDPLTTTLKTLSLDVIVDQTWAVIPNVISFDKCLLQVTMHEPLSAVERKISVLVEGETNLGGKKIHLSGKAPQYEFSGELAAGEVLKCKPLLRQLMPDINMTSLPDFDISRLILEVSPYRHSYRVSTTIETHWRISLGSTQVELVDIGVDMTAGGADLMNDSYAFLQGIIELAGYSFVMKAKLPDLAFSGYLLNGNDLPVKSLLQEVSGGHVALPDELSSLAIHRPNFSIAPMDNTFAFSGACKNLLNISLGVVNLALKEISVSLDRKNTAVNQYQFSMVVSAEAELRRNNDLLNVQLSIYYSDNPSQWLLLGKISQTSNNDDVTFSSIVNTLLPSNIQLPDDLLTLGVSQVTVKYDFTQSLLTLDAISDGIVTLRGVGSLQARQLSVAVSINPSDLGEFYWSVQIKGHLTLGNSFEFKGLFDCFNDQRGFGINFRPEDQTVLTFPLPLPEYQRQSISLQLEMGAISIVETSSDFHLDGKVSVSFINLPPFFDNIIADRIVGQFTMNGQSARISINQLFENITFTLPHIPVPTTVNQSKKLELGDMLLNLKHIELTLGDDITIAAQLSIGLPSQLNHIFGLNQQGEPRANIFNCYDISQQNTTFIRMLISASGQGITINLMDSPFSFIEFENINNETWCHCDFSASPFGDLGAVKFRVPEFSFDVSSSSFKASGAFEIIKPLKLPLGLLKSFLSENNQTQLSEALPDAVALKTVSLLDNNKLNIGALLEHFETVSGSRVRLNQRSKKSLEAIENIFDQLPDRLKEYFTLSVPDSLDFSIAITPDGGVIIDVSTRGDPIKVLFFNPFNLMLIGMEFRGFSFGEILGGQLFILKADMMLDYFDPLSLAAAALPDNNWLPDSRGLYNRIIFRNVTTLISYQTSVPIPVPVFFDELGIEIKGVHGFECQSHIRFPQPTLNPKEFLLLASELSHFCSDKPYLLKSNLALDNIDPRFTLGSNYIQLPEYLGGELLGSKQDIASISAYEVMAKLLNGLKTFSPEKLLNVIPLDHRVGSQSIKFFQSSVDISWLVATKKEFSQVGLPLIVLATAEKKNLQQLSAGVSKNSIILFMSGQGMIANQFALEAQLVVAYDESIGANTGFQLQGSFADRLVQLSVAGEVTSNAKKALSVQGLTQLSFFGETVLKGTVTLNDNSLLLTGNINLFPQNSLFQVSGKVRGEISDRELLIKGKVKCSFGKHFILKQAALIINHSSVEVEGTYLSQVVVLRASQVGQRILLSAAMSPVVIPSLFSLTGPSSYGGPLLEVSTGVSKSVTLTLSGYVSLLSIVVPTRLQLTSKGYQFSIEGRVFNRAAANIQVTASTNLLKSEAFLITATLKPSFLTDLSGNIARQIQEVVLPVQASLNDLTSIVDNEKSSLDAITQQIIAKLRQLRLSLTAAKRNAEKEVARLEASLSQLTGELKKVKDQVKADNADTRAKMKTAKNNLEKTNMKVKTLTDRIDFLKKQLSIIPATLIPSYLAEIVLRESELITQLIVKTTAETTLNVAKVIVDSVAALGAAAVNTALGEVNRTKTYLTRAKSAHSNATEALNNIVSHTEMTMLNSKYQIQQQVYDTAKVVMNQFKQTNQLLLNVVNAIRRYGVDALVDVKSASFSGKLTAVKSGKVNLSIRYKLKGRAISTWQLQFDFNHINRGIDNISKHLLSVMKGGR